MVKEINLKQYFSQVHTIQSSSEAFTLNLPNGGRNVTHLLACFLQTGRTGTIKKSSNDFSSGYTYAYPEVKITSDAVTNLQMIRFQLDKTYPNPDYLLNFSSALSDNCQDVSHMFYDMLNNFVLLVLFSLFFQKKPISRLKKSFIWWKDHQRQFFKRHFVKC